MGPNHGLIAFGEYPASVYKNLFRVRNSCLQVLLPDICISEMFFTIIEIYTCNQEVHRNIVTNQCIQIRFETCFMGRNPCLVL